MDENKLVHEWVEARFGHLERRVCDASSPMALADKDRYRWGHPDAVEVAPFFNLVICRCPHCGLTFSCLPRDPAAMH